MVLTIEAWLNGISAVGVVVTNIIIGIYILYRSFKLDAKLLKYAGAMIILIGLLWSGPAMDFTKILLTGTNIPENIKFLYVYASYIWVAPAILLALTIGAEMIAPQRKKAILIFIGITSALFEIGVIVFPYLSYTFPDPHPTGGELIDTSLNFAFFTFYALFIIILTIIIFNGVGSFLKAKDSTGILKRKFIYLGLAFIVFPAAAVFDTLIPPGAFLSIVRMLIIVSAVFLYLGLKP
ncbi:MAG: conserved membrane protein of unknown function [Promethearchaeota archaeon]|nr:MAG: conserved membrane protein of unknown function [Candidatus Lokiarchaeota archaeon]